MNALLAPAGFHLRWFSSGSAHNSSPERIVSIDLRGSCKPATKVQGVFRNYSALASSAVVDGEVLPFTWIDCTALNQFLKGALPAGSDQEREQTYGRAMARLLAHEFYHVLARTETHTIAGIAKAQFKVQDLLAPQMAFELSALHILRRGQAEPVQVASTAETDLDTESEDAAEILGR